MLGRARPAFARAALVTCALALALAAWAHPALADQFASITDAGYNPASITIHQGESITWVNQGSLPHSVTADDGSFDSGPIAPGERAGNTFTELGTFNIHSTMDAAFHGQIVVLGIDVTAAPSARPTSTSALPFGTRDPSTPGPSRPSDESSLAALAATAAIVIVVVAMVRLGRRRRPG
jgi:plastocyanin